MGAMKVFFLCGARFLPDLRPVRSILTAGGTVYAVICHACHRFRASRVGRGQIRRGRERTRA